VSDTAHRRLELLSRVIAPSGDFDPKRLCEVCVEVTATSGAGIMLVSGDVPRGALCATNEVSALIEELQFSLGEGPCVDAYSAGRPVMEPDLAEPAVARWLAFSGPAVAAGVRAVFGFPLQVGAVRLGALNLYCETARALTGAEYSDALLMADITAQALLLLQADAAPETIAAELEANADFRYVVHRATGMVAAQLDVSVSQAVVRLRAHAFANDRRLDDVAQDVVERRLRFERTDPNDPRSRGHEKRKPS
jgi:hypothetical protein